MSVAIAVAKVCCCVFFGIIFAVNLIDLMKPGVKGAIGSDLYFEKQIWMVISLLAIAIVLGNL